MIFNEYSLNDLCNVGSSKRIYLSEYVSEGIPFYRGKEIIEKSNGKNITSELFISEERYEEIKKRFKVPNIGDILISAVGTLGKCWYVDEEKFYFKDGNLVWLNEFNEKVINPKFLYYNFTSKWFENIIDGICIGSTQKALTIEQLKKIVIKVPSIDIQNKIVKILDSLNKKIKINAEINNNLYDLTNKLYEKLFVKNRDESWHEYNLLELADFTNGYSYTGKELVEESDIGMATIKNFERTGGFKEDGFKPLNPIKSKEQHEAKLFDILVACTDLTQNADIIGNAVMLLNTNNYDKVVISMDLVKVLPKNNHFMIYSILNSREFKNHALGYKSGTTVLHLNKDCFKDFNIKLPKQDIIDKFQSVAETNYKKISANLKENKTLEQLRDTLLPKLMNGEIDLNNIEI